MGIDLLGLVLVQRYKTVQDIVACGSVVRSTFSQIRFLMFSAMFSDLVQLAFVVWEVILHRGHRELLFKSIDFVQEQDY